MAPIGDRDELPVPFWEVRFGEVARHVSESEQREISRRY